MSKEYAVIYEYRVKVRLVIEANSAEEAIQMGLEEADKEADINLSLHEAKAIEGATP